MNENEKYESKKSIPAISVQYNVYFFYCIMDLLCLSYFNYRWKTGATAVVALFRLFTHLCVQVNYIDVN